MQDEASVDVEDEEGSEDEAVEECLGVDVDDEVSAGDEDATERCSQLGVLLQEAEPQEAEDADRNQQTWSRASLE